METAISAMQAERDENTCREGFKPSEAVALGRAIEELERPKAKERHRENGGDRKSAAAKSAVSIGHSRSGDQGHKTREVVAKAIGMGSGSYYRAKTVIEAAEQDPETFDEIDCPPGSLPAALWRSGDLRLRQPHAEEAAEILNCCQT